MLYAGDFRLPLGNDLTMVLGVQPPWMNIDYPRYSGKSAKMRLKLFKTIGVGRVLQRGAFHLSFGKSRQASRKVLITIVLILKPTPSDERKSSGATPCAQDNRINAMYLGTGGGGKALDACA